jgi:hypothetical protein
MNFWEARQASKAGKTVKCFTLDGWCELSPEAFKKYDWSIEEFDADWEIVPDTYTFRYVTWMPRGIVARVDITFDETGKLVSARNVK